MRMVYGTGVNSKNPIHQSVMRSALEQFLRGRAAALSQPAAQGDLLQAAKAVAFSNGFDAAYPDKLEALLAAIAKAQGDSSHPAGGECGRVQAPSVTVIGLDAIYAAEIERVSNVPYDSQAICRWFYRNLRDAICAKATA
ncbi:MAG: hypothetical protein B7X65_13745 [Polaromonas sp. 39-63-25]|nr:MAG: hypothetical protein B7Y09_16245 [Polaromonas sp. 24-63-21]OZA87242.1 MAG: hypothetical protein B7X65_13745 [Polaromonas sp. 39-63-25]